MSDPNLTKAAIGLMFIMGMISPRFGFVSLFIFYVNLTIDHKWSELLGIFQ